MNRKEKLLSGLRLRESVGLEIGPLCRPFVRKDEGEVIYIDHLDAEALRRKYREDAKVDKEQIVEVDVVWRGGSLQKCIGEEKKVDYIVASHVIEHVPDLISWLAELRSVLKPTGEVRLLVPDRRFTFDFLRRETSLADVLQSYLVSARMPQPHSVLDFYLNYTEIDCIEAWEGRLDPRSVRSPDGFERAISAARNVLDYGIYDDVHCWVFTPRSFGRLFGRLAQAGLVEFACERFYDTGQNQLEFCVWLKPSSDKAYATESWRSMSEAAREDVPGSDQAAIKSLTEKVAEIEAELSQAREHAMFLSSQLKQVESSRSWRITRPLRSISHIVRRVF